MGVPLSQTYGKQKSPPKTSSDWSLEVTRVTGIWPRKIYLQWMLRNPGFADGYVFTVSRSGSAEGPWTDVATGLSDTYFLVDDGFPAPCDLSGPGLFSLRRTIYYRVTATHTVDGSVESVKKLEAGLDRRRQGIVRKLRRDARVVLRKGSGTEVAILKRRWWGEPCDCTTKTGQVTRSHCRKCFGTGIISGYWDPVYGFAVRTSAPVVEDTGTQGNVETHNLQVRMYYIPQVSAQDILVFMRDNKRYIVEVPITTEIHTVEVHQELQVSELSRSSREYNIPVDDWHDPAWF
jgi:hypothetical protein